MRNVNKKTLMVWIDKALHHEIKSRSSLMNISMTEFIEAAVLEKIEDQNFKGLKPKQE